MPTTEFSIPEFAALCREKCSNTAQGHDDLPCGNEREVDGERVFSFCGAHWGAVLGGY